MTKLLLLSGGTGSSKLIRSLLPVTRDFSVLANVGDNVWMHGLYVCPDLDIAMYALAGTLDLEKGWGIVDDSYSTLNQLKALGGESWFTLGDKDLATHIRRTELLRSGLTLSQVTSALCSFEGVGQRLMPPTDSHVETRVLTPEGDLHLQEFWVRDRGRAEVRGFRYQGIEDAVATESAVQAVVGADRIIFCPANPVTSIMPILNVRGIREALSSSAALKVAISPFAGGVAFSGPAEKFIRAAGLQPGPVSLARLYAGAVDRIIVDTADEGVKREVESLGPECVVADIRFSGTEAGARIARLALEG